MRIRVVDEPEPDWTAETQLCNRIPPLSESPYPWITKAAVLDWCTMGRVSQPLIDYVLAQHRADPLYGALLAEAAGLTKWNQQKGEWEWLPSSSS